MGVILGVLEAETTLEGVVVGEFEGEVLALTVVVGVFVLVSEPLAVCVGVGVMLEVGVEDGVIDELAIDVPVTCEDNVNKKLFPADSDIAAVLLILLVPTPPLNDVIDE